MALNKRAEYDVEVRAGCVAGSKGDVRRALEVRRSARYACPPLRHKAAVCGGLHVDPVKAGTQDQSVVAGQVGVGAADALAAGRGASEARADKHIRHTRAAWSANLAADDESLVELRVDAVLVRRCGDRRRRVEGGRVVVPLAEIARAGRRPAEEGERDLHVVARGNNHRVLPIEIGLRSAYELAAALCRVVRADVEADDWNGPRRVGDATVY